MDLTNMIKILLFIQKASLYIDLKVAFTEHILQENIP